MAKAKPKTRALVVDDDPAVRELLRLSLLALGIEVTQADDLASARAALAEPFDLVILDFYLQPEDGTDLVGDVLAHVPILLLTGSFDTSELLGKHPRINEALRKPFDQMELRSAVKRLLGSKEPG